ncbi:MAG: hypothetical protein QOH31_1503 [Verrucomicrobiota bacterium]
MRVGVSAYRRVRAEHSYRPRADRLVFSSITSQQPSLTTGRGSSARGQELSTIHLESQQLNRSASDDMPNTGGANTDVDSTRNRRGPHSTREDNSNPDRHNNAVHRTPVLESGIR